MYINKYFGPQTQPWAASVLPGGEWGDKVPLLGPADGGWWDTMDLTWQDGVLPLNHWHPNWLCGASSTFSVGSGTHCRHTAGQQTCTESVKLLNQKPLMGFCVNLVGFCRHQHDGVYRKRWAGPSWRRGQQRWPPCRLTLHSHSRKESWWEGCRQNPGRSLDHPNTAALHPTKHIKTFCRLFFWTKLYWHKKRCDLLCSDDK